MVNSLKLVGKSRRLTFIECPNDLGAIIDLAKIADLVLLMIDGSFGFEMEVFEALSAMSSHGLPKIIAVLTHLDLMKKPAIVKAQKKKIKQRFWTEVYDGAKMFYLSGVMNGRYPDREILNLSRFINVAKFRPLIFRNTHPYFLADRIEDLTSRDLIRQSPKEDRTVALYGYLRGIPLRPPSETHDLRVHIPGSGVDAFSAHKLTRLPDPCPLPTKESEKRRKLSDKDRICHAPMSGGGSGGQITVDADTVYINTAGSFSRRVDEVGNPGMFSLSSQDKPVAYCSIGIVEAGEGEQMVMDLQDVKSSLADNIAQVEIRLFGQSSAPIRVNKNTKEEDPDFDTDEDASDLDEDEVDSELVLDQEEEAEESVEDSGDLRSPQTGARNKHRQRRSALASLTNEDHEPNAEEIAFDDDSDVEISANDNGSTIDEEGNDLEDDSDDNVEEKEDEPKWKQNLSVKAQTSFDNRLKKKTKDWTKLIYSSNLSPEQIINGSLGPVLEEDEDELFQVARVYAESEDCFKPPIDRQALKKWQDDAMLDSIRHRFITGSLDANGIGTEGGKEYDSETGEGFVDLEGEDEEDVEGAEKEEQIVEDQGQEDLAKKKEQLKRKFDQQYDNESDSDAGEDFFTTTKKDMLRRLETTRAEFANETLENRAMLEGHHPGCYVRLEISGVPSELLEKFDPTFPLLVGGLLAHEESFGYVTVRLKKHRWAPRILKTNDPLVFSVGWRRFQSIPLYSLEDGTRNRLLKYTPEHMHCLATFYGPISNPQTGFCAFNSVALQAGFRVSASGTVIDIDASTAIVKKLKLTGTPYKIFKNTAFIKDMFTSSLEVAKFEGAQIRTVSGIRGQIKKALAKPEGTYRATFEDRILSSDIIFLRSWTKIEPRNFYYPMDSLLLPDKSLWQGMRLTGQVRAEEGVKTPSLSNSQYKVGLRLLSEYQVNNPFTGYRPPHQTF